MIVDFSAREGHFADHLAPVWRALDPELRGTFYVGDPALDHALELGLDPEVGFPKRRRDGSPVVVAASGDLNTCSRLRRPVVLFEHGAGQSYANRHPSYAGGKGREKVSVFLVPGPGPAARNRRRYPSTPNVEIGSPRVDALREIPRTFSSSPLAVISFHWRCEVTKETYTALDHYAAELERVRIELEEEGIALAGHAHPRILEEASAIYRGAGLEVIESFDEVVARADLYAVDNSSTLFEFAALDRPVVVLNAPHFRRGVNYGLRFWTEADVGLNVDGPDELVPAVLESFENQAELAEVRRAAVARTYSVLDGTSAHLAASAIGALVNPGACLVCGTGSCACGKKTTVVAVDDRLRSSEPMGEPKKRYPNPARKGAFLKLTDRSAERLGLIGQAVEDRPRADLKVDVTNPGGSEVVSSSSSDDEKVPEGAIPKGGPTARARKKALEEAAADEEEGTVTEDDEHDEPKDKARKAPSSTRRRRAPSTTKKAASTKKDA